MEIESDVVVGLLQSLRDDQMHKMRQYIERQDMVQATLALGGWFCCERLERELKLTTELVCRRQRASSPKH